MEQGRIDEPLSGEVVRRLLTGRALARLACIARDGTPRVIPIGVHRDGSSVVRCTTTNAARVAALRASSRVALTIDTDDFPPNVLLLRGAVELEWGDGIPDEYLRINDPEYMTAGQRADWEKGVHELYDAMYRIRLTPDWVKVLDFETTLPSAVEELMSRRSAGD